MKGRVLLGLVIAAVIVISMVEVVGTETAPPAGNAATISAGGNPCVTDADCTGNRICCPISGTCTTVKGCRKDPLR